MKNLVLLVGLFILSGSLVAQNVGIDEPNPSEKLDVNGRIVAKGYKNTVYTAGGINSGAVSIPGSGGWSDFPDLSVTFTLDEATTVMSSYNISMSAGGGSFMVTRLMIDDVEVNRIVYPGGSYFFNNDEYVSELAAGSHTIKVQYRSNGGGTNNPAGTDWQNRFLQVLVFGSN